MTKAQRFEGCIIGGAIGDALGSAYENVIEQKDENTLYLFGKPEKVTPTWQITDDTQLTLATIEAMIEDIQLKPETLVKHFLKLYKQRKLRGIANALIFGSVVDVML